MALKRPIVLQLGQRQQQLDADTLIVGAGITTSTGALALSAANNVVNLLANQGLVALTGTGSLDFSLATGIFKTSTGAVTIGPGAVGISGATTLTSSLTQSGGAFSLTGNSASSLSTSAGALTLSGFSGINLQNNGTTVLSLGAAALTVQAGVTLGTTGTGNINLPNNASARFQIETVTVSTNVTAANLGTLTAGTASNADTLHTHAGLGIMTGLTTTGLASGDIGYISANNTIVKTDNTVAIKSRFAGVNTGTAGALQVSGPVLVNFSTGLTPIAGDRCTSTPRPTLARPPTSPPAPAAPT